MSFLNTIKNTLAIGGGAAAGAAATAASLAALKSFNEQLQQARERQQALTTTNTISLLNGSEASYFTKIQIATYNRTSITSYPKLNTGGGIILPIPQALNDSHTVNWSEEPLNLAGGAAEAGSQFLQGNVGAASAIAATSAAAKASQALGAAGNVVQALAGLAPNEFLTVLLKGPTYKKYTLSWLVSANTPEQSRLFKEIIKRVNASMAPEPMGGVFKYPNVFQVSLHKGASENQFLYKFKPAVLDNFSVNYAGGGIPGFYSDGAPQAIILSMAFHEIEFWKPSDFT
jgi:hypothetical protein